MLGKKLRWCKGSAVGVPGSFGDQWWWRIEGDTILFCANIDKDGRSNTYRISVGEFKEMVSLGGKAVSLQCRTPYGGMETEKFEPLAAAIAESLAKAGRLASSQS